MPGNGIVGRLAIGRHNHRDALLVHGWPRRAQSRRRGDHGQLVGIFVDIRLHRAGGDRQTNPRGFQAVAVEEFNEIRVVGQILTGDRLQEFLGGLTESIDVGTQPKDAPVLCSHRLEEARAVKPAAVKHADRRVRYIDDFSIVINEHAHYIGTLSSDCCASCPLPTACRMALALASSSFHSDSAVLSATIAPPAYR